MVFFTSPVYLSGCTDLNEEADGELLSLLEFELLSLESWFVLDFTRGGSFMRELVLRFPIDDELSLSTSLYMRNLLAIRDGDQETPSVHLFMPDISSINTNILPDTIRYGLSISYGLLGMCLSFPSSVAWRIRRASFSSSM